MSVELRDSLSPSTVVNAKSCLCTTCLRGYVLSDILAVSLDLSLDKPEIISNTAGLLSGRTQYFTNNEKSPRMLVMLVLLTAHFLNALNFAKLRIFGWNQSAVGCDFTTHTEVH